MTIPDWEELIEQGQPEYDFPLPDGFLCGLECGECKDFPIPVLVRGDSGDVFFGLWCIGCNVWYCLAKLR